MMRRLRIIDQSNYAAASPDAFLRRQLQRAGVASAPYAAAGFPDYDSEPLLGPAPPSFAWAAWGFAASVAALASVALVPRRFRAPMACLVLTGFCWALAARGNTFAIRHSYEALFYIGLPLSLSQAALIGARRLLGARLGGAIAISAAALAAPVFALSAFQAAQTRLDADAAKRAKEVMADMSAISEIVSEKSVAVSPNATRMGNARGRSGDGMNYYLAGSYWGGGASGRADYAVSRYRNDSFNLLTPGNRHLFLYERADLHDIYRAERRRLEASEPDARSEFDVYLEEGALRYLKSPCAPGDADAPIFAYFFPPDAAYLRGEGDPIGFNGVSFPFDAVSNVGGDCMATVNVPSYPIAAIQTGQYISGGERLWEVSIFPPPSAETLADYESAYQAVADGEPAAQSGFDIYIDADGGAISYLKRPCTQDDIRGRFFLSVHPADAADLPENRRGIGHESRNFDFVPPHGVMFNGKCMATIQLPDYEIAKIATGQDAPDAGRLWAAEIAVGD